MSRMLAVTAFAVFAAGALSSALAQTGATGKTFFEKHLNDTAIQESTFTDLMNAMPNPSASSTAASVLVPMSRSLQKQHASMEDPRVLFSISENGAPDTFIGHARKSGETEVISWNPEKAKYEFLLVKMGVDGAPAVVTHPDPAVCITCHQNGGPIFSHFPWSETDFNSSVRGSVTNPFKDIQDKKGIGSGNGFGLDGAVRSANRSIQQARMCKELCKGNLECNRYLLMFLLQSGSTVFSSRNQVRESEFEKLFPNLIPKDGFGFAQSTLPDLDPYNAPEKGGTVTLAISSDTTKPLADRILTTDDTKSTQSASNTARFQSFQNANGTPPAPATNVEVYGSDLGSVGHPATPRAIRQKLRTTADVSTFFRSGTQIGACIRDSGPLLKVLNPFDQKTIDKLVFTDKAFDSILSSSSWPVDGSKIVAAIPVKDTHKQTLATCGLDERGMPISKSDVDRMKAMEANILAPVKNVALTATDRAIAIKDFKASCAACHGPGTPMTFSSKSKNFIFDFGNLQHLKDYGKEGGTVPYKGSKTIAEVLKNKSMPPNADATGFTDEQRELMIQVLTEP